MLPNVCYDNGITLGQFTHTFYNCLWLDDTFLLIVRTNTVLILSYFLNPFLSVIMNSWFREQEL